MSFIPQTNCTIVSLVRQSSSEDYNWSEVDNSTLWRGSWDAYVQQKIVANFNVQGGLDRILQVTLYVGLDFPVEIQSGDILTYAAGNPDSPQTMAGRVQTFTNPAWLADLPDYYKIALEEVNAP